MSHAATNWAIRQRGLKPASKIVLWHLADRHNADTGRCDPDQAKLAADCEMSRSTLNLHLAELERRGLIQRIQRLDERTKRQVSTFYRLAFDGPFPGSENRTRTIDVGEAPQYVVCAVSDIETRSGSENRTRSVSEKQAEPCPKNRDFRVRISDTNPVREPGREPGREEQAREFDAFWAIYPRKVGKDAARKAWLSARKRAGLEVIVGGLRGFVAATTGADQQFIPHPATWLNQGRWQDEQSHARNGPRTSTADLQGLATISATDDLARLWGPTERKAIGQ